MEYSGLLNTLAQIALGTLGFTGVVIAVKHTSEVWDKVEKIRFQALVTTTLTALFGSLLPQIISIEINDVNTVWRLANLCLGILHLLNFGSILITVKREKIRPEFEGIKEIIDTIIGPSLIILHFVAASGFIHWLELLFIIGVLQQLYIGISNFLKFIHWDN